MNKYEFMLEGGVKVEFETPLGVEALAGELMAQPADGYVCDDDVVIPVRRVIAAGRVKEGRSMWFAEEDGKVTR